MWIAAGELEDAIGIYTEELMRIGARAVAMETKPTSGARGYASSSAMIPGTSLLY